MATSKVYLIPTPLYPEILDHTTEWTKKICQDIKHFYVENIRTARRVLKKYDASIVIDDIQFEEINHRSTVDTTAFIDWVKKGYNIGIMSEAGMPAVADPGHILIAKAHELGAQVIPLTGPNSIILSLAASGFNGQMFTFHGYLPIQAPDLHKKLQQLEAGVQQGYTQIFIETPFRNNNLLKCLTDRMPHRLKLCVACDLTAETEYIKTMSIKDWKQALNQVDLHKRPTIFLLNQ